jgi:hypothetical protein
VLLNIHDVDFQTDLDLVVKYASRPIHKPSTLYNVSYTQNIAPMDKYNMEYEFRTTPTVGSIPSPPDPTQQITVDLLAAPTMVFRTSGSSEIGDHNIYTDDKWFTSAVALRFGSSYPSSACSWFIDNGTDDYWYCPYGFNFPSGYDIVMVNKLYAFTENWRSNMLFTNVNGELRPAGCCVPIVDNVYYDVDLVKRSDGTVINRTGSSNDGYMLGRSPYSTNMALYVPTDSYGTRGDIKGQILVTETPWT